MSGLTGQSNMFRPGKFYGQANDDGRSFYFSVESTGDTWNRLSGYVSAEGFDALATRLDLPRLASVPQKDRSTEKALQRAMDRFQQALRNVKNGTYQTPEWMADLSHDLERRFEPTGHPFQTSDEADCCGVCAQPQLGHKVEERS